MGQSLKAQFWKLGLNPKNQHFKMLLHALRIHSWKSFWKNDVKSVYDLDLSLELEFLKILSFANQNPTFWC